MELMEWKWYEGLVGGQIVDEWTKGFKVGNQTSEHGLFQGCQASIFTPIRTVSLALVNKQCKTYSIGLFWASSL